MKLYPTTAALAFALAAASNPALAQDPDTQQETATSSSNRDTHFDGFYISGAIGMGTHSNDRNDRIVFDTNGDGDYNDTVRTATGADAFSPGFCNGEARGPTRASGCAKDDDGLEYAARAGYDRRMGENFVVGGLLEVSKNESKDGTSAFSTTPASYGVVRELDYAASLRARAGYTPGGGALFYLTGGGSYAKIDHRFFTTNQVNAFDEERDSKKVWGWQAGGGSEIMVTDKVSLGLEYLYNRYDDNKYRVAVTQGSAPPTNPFILASGGTNLRPSDKSWDFHSLRATVGYQF